MKRDGERNTEESAGTTGTVVTVAKDSAEGVDSVEAMSREEAAMEAVDVNDEGATGTWFEEEDIEESNGEGNEVWGSGSAKGKAEDEEGEEDEQQWPESGPTPLHEEPMNEDTLPGECSLHRALPRSPTRAVEGENLGSRGVSADEMKAEEQEESKDEIEVVEAPVMGPPTPTEGTELERGSGLD